MVDHEPGDILNRPSAGQAAALGGTSIAAAVIAIGVAQIELNGQSQPHIWSNVWLLAALALALIGVAIAVVFFVMSMFAHKQSQSVNISIGTEKPVPAQAGETSQPGQAVPETGTRVADPSPTLPQPPPSGPQSKPRFTRVRWLGKLGTNVVILIAAGNMVSQSEKLLSENADKLPDDVKSELEEAVVELKKALDGTDSDAKWRALDKVRQVYEKAEIATPT